MKIAYMYRNLTFRDIVPYALNLVLNRIRQIICTVLSQLYMIWWGIKFGKSSKFYGFPIMHKHPTGKIIIGDNAQFRSAEWSNSIGINRRCYISANRNATIQIGNDCGFSGTIIATSQSIQIGNRVLCGANCTIVDSDRHPLDPSFRPNLKTALTAPVIIEDDVWLGMNVVVLKGCTIGHGSVIAANSVVTHSIPTNVIAGGIPARVIREIQ